MKVALDKSVKIVYIQTNFVFHKYQTKTECYNVLDLQVQTKYIQEVIKQSLLL